MKMTRKLLPSSLYDGPGMESWLESRANEGLFPVKLGYFQAVFSPIGVPGTRFRLVVKAGKEEEMPRRSGSSLKKPAGGISALSPACTISFAPPTPTPRKSIPTGKAGESLWSQSESGSSPAGAGGGPVMQSWRRCWSGRCSFTAANMTFSLTAPPGCRCSF